MKSILFVCTGNTCRSPLAEALLRREATRRAMKVEVSSAGTLAVEGTPASRHSMRAATRREADLSRHRSRPLTRDIVDDADQVLAMTPTHLRWLRREYGRELNLALVTDCLPIGDPERGAPVTDPIAGGEEEYEAVAAVLERCVSALLDRWGEVA